MGEGMAWESAGGPSAQFLKTHSGTISQPDKEVSVCHGGSEVQTTFDLNSPVVDGAHMETSEASQAQSKTLSHAGDEFDEPAPEKHSTAAASSPFSNYLSERKVSHYEEDTQFYASTRSGRWTTVADAGEGCDGFKTMVMLKPITGGKPEMRSKSSFEIRNLSSFRMNFV